MIFCEFAKSCLAVDTTATNALTALPCTVPHPLDTMRASTAVLLLAALAVAQVCVALRTVDGLPEVSPGEQDDIHAARLRELEARIAKRTSRLPWWQPFYRPPRVYFLTRARHVLMQQARRATPSWRRSTAS